MSIHIIAVGCLQIWSMQTTPIIKNSRIFHVELVSLQIAADKFSMKTEIAKPLKKQEAVQQKTVNIPAKKVSANKQDTQKESANESKKEEKIPGNQLKVETQNFPFSYYIGLLKFRIQENWRTPFQKSDQISAIVGFEVERTGKIINIIVEKSSAVFMYDQAALRAIHLSSPMPPLPDEYPGEHLSVHIEFEGICTD